MTAGGEATATDKTTAGDKTKASGEKMPNTFTEYTDYRARSTAALPQAEYDAIAGQAYAEILLQTHGRAKNAPCEMREALRDCECALIDVIAGYARAASILPRGMTAAQNDGFSVSAQGRKPPACAQREECAAVCARYLHYPINMLCGWL